MAEAVRKMKLGITALLDGRGAEAQELLQESLDLDPLDDRGWLWLSRAVEDRDMQKAYLEKALEINPKNAVARQELEALAGLNEHNNTGARTVSDEQPAATRTCPHCGAVILKSHLVFCPDCGVNMPDYAVHRTQASDTVAKTAQKCETPDQPDTGARTPTWEHKVVQLDEVLKAGFGRMGGESLSYNANKIQQSVSQYGAQGWELVSVIPTLGRHGTSRNLLLFFKRPKG